MARTPWETTVAGSGAPVDPTVTGTGADVTPGSPFPGAGEATGPAGILTVSAFFPVAGPGISSQGAVELPPTTVDTSSTA